MRAVIENPPQARIRIPESGDWISSNERTHWSKRARKTKMWRGTAAWIGKTVDARFTCQVDIHAVVHKQVSRGRWDAHNLMPTLKAAIDGLVVAGVLPDDNNDVVRRVSIAAGKASRTQPGLMITIKPVTEQEEAA